MPEVLCQDDGCAYDAYSYMNDDCWVHIFFSKKNDVVKHRTIIHHRLLYHIQMMIPPSWLRSVARYIYEPVSFYEETPRR